MRCPSCGKFVPYDTEHEAEIENADVTDGELKIEVTRALPCGVCGDDLKSASFEFTVDLDTESAEDHTEECEAKHDAFMGVIETEQPDGVADDREWTVDLSVENTERQDNEDRPPRYRTTYYGAVVTGTATCECGAVVEINEEDDTSASSFDELV